MFLCWASSNHFSYFFTEKKWEVNKPLLVSWETAAFQAISWHHTFLLFNMVLDRVYFSPSSSSSKIRTFHFLNYCSTWVFLNFVRRGRDIFSEIVTLPRKGSAPNPAYLWCAGNMCPVCYVFFLLSKNGGICLKPWVK